MGGLTNLDPKYWAPDRRVLDWVVKQVPDGARVLEIGPGYVPFPKADTFVDLRELPNLPGRVYKMDFTHNPLPFADKTFDFIYCRHVLEDMYDPFPLCREMSRVGRAGYIETPSPIAEMCRGIDGNSPPWRGYHHHRFMVWDDGALTFVSKFPIIEFMDFDPAPLLKEPALWNTYHLWEDEITVRHLESPVDFDITTQYHTVLADAARKSQVSSLKFLQKVNNGS